jgi:ADP-ribose pyrophosphatase YjhB (NUDIX family)
MIIPMTYDIHSDKAVNLVIFTVVEDQVLMSKVWDEDQISPVSAIDPKSRGLSLFVVTVPASEELQARLENSRALPGGYLLDDETLKSASQRILFDQLGISPKIRIRQSGIYDEPDRNPLHRELAFTYWAMVDFNVIRKSLGGRDRIGLELVNNSKFLEAVPERFEMPLEDFDGICRFGNRLMPKPGVYHKKTLTKDLPSGRILALDHDDMVFYAWRAMRHAFDGKLDPFRYLGVNPLGEAFRLSEAQEFSEICLGEKIDRDQFRRRVDAIERSNIQKLHGTLDNSRPGKPANLYSLLTPVDADEEAWSHDPTRIRPIPRKKL